MTDQVTPELGFLPWRPSNDAELIEVFDRYDRPLIGVVREGGSEHLFACIAGQTDDWNAWVYTRIDPDEHSLLENADDFDSALSNVVRGKSCILALASEIGIVDASFVEYPEEIPGTLATLLDRVGRQTLRHSAVDRWTASGLRVSPSPSTSRSSVASLDMALAEIQNKTVALMRRRQNETLDYQSNAGRGRPASRLLS